MIFGDEVIWTPWQRPGFDLGLQLQEICRKHPQAKGVILGQHGLINWANDDKNCYELSLTLIEKAARYLSEHDKGDGAFGGAKYQPLDLRGAAQAFRRAAAVAARAGEPAQALHRHDPGRRRHARLRRQRRRAAAGRARHLVPGPLSAHQDQAALRRLESADRRRCHAAPEDRGGSRRLPPRLPRLLRALQARRLAQGARRQPDRRARARPGASLPGARTRASLA